MRKDLRADGTPYPSMKKKRKNRGNIEALREYFKRKSDVLEECSTPQENTPTTPAPETAVAISAIDKTTSLLGSRMVDIWSILEKVKNISSHTPFGCTFADMNVIQVKENGLQFTITFECSMCHLCETISNNDENVAKQLDLNTPAVSGAIAAGIGHKQLELSSPRRRLLRMESAEATIRGYHDVSGGGLAVIMKDEVMIKQEAITIDHGMISDVHHDEMTTPSNSLASTHQPEVKDEPDIHHDGGPAVLIKEELVIKEEAITVDDGMITVDHQYDMGTPSSSTASTRQPEVKEEGDMMHERHSCIGDFIMKDELVIEGEPVTGDDDMAHSALQADPTSTSPCLASQQSHSSATHDESVVSVCGGKPHACDICDYRTGRLSHLNIHLRSHTGGKPYNCDVCDFRTGDLSNLNRHAKTHTGEKPHACDSCDLRTGDLGSLKRHMRSHTGEKPYSCDICDYRTGDLSSLKTHLRTHTGEKPYSCDTCDFRTGILSNLKRHMRSHTGEKPYSCEFCDYRTGDLGSLKTHVRTHTGEKPYSCDMCDYRTAHLSLLKTHKWTHTGEKPYSCDICDYRTAHLSLLKTHKWTHTGEKPYSCDICDYRTGYLKLLKIHKRTHTGEKPYSCELCDYRTGDLRSLKTHVRIHTGGKPFACDRCDYRARYIHNLKTHLRVHTGEKPFACDICDYRAARIGTLRRHMTTRHK